MELGGGGEVSGGVSGSGGGGVEGEGGEGGRGGGIGLYWVVLGIAVGAAGVGWGGFMAWRRLTMGEERKCGEEMAKGKEKQVVEMEMGDVGGRRKMSSRSRGHEEEGGRLGSGAVWISRDGVRLRRAGSGTRPVLHAGVAGRAHLGGGPWVVRGVLRQKDLLGCVRLPDGVAIYFLLGRFRSASKKGCLSGKGAKTYPR